MTDFAPSLNDYPYQVALTSRLEDNDENGYINNVTFYSFFDTAVSRFLKAHCPNSAQLSKITTYVVSSQCQYISPAAYPEAIFVGVRVVKIGRSSVTYGLSVYAGESQRRVAHGQFVHVYVDKTTDNAVPIPADVKEALGSKMEEF
ncbi:thioesterase family protein [Alteromonas sp. C1M14]|uniref:acyl-CoA thioesterase n=1 Tax=Alteromonas sp. C1M14 TaxID=2841567 RepID=UPI001C0814A0|nr:thioesterase family protein [Alteromonas sp. C1M14]MBU2978395.1 acyl-CoA thioesterase [Alteromonas sp. C1M14]